MVLIMRQNSINYRIINIPLLYKETSVTDTATIPEITPPLFCYLLKLFTLNKYSS